VGDDSCEHAFYAESFMLQTDYVRDFAYSSQAFFGSSLTLFPLRLLIIIEFRLLMGNAILESTVVKNFYESCENFFSSLVQLSQHRSNYSVVEFVLHIAAVYDFYLLMSMCKLGRCFFCIQTTLHITYWSVHSL
jgi:hypothetical protein